MLACLLLIKPEVSSLTRQVTQEWFLCPE